ncbi:hypothetical protein P170DRAFT_471123 [Aspergillus steynii IBT 23096]|uniref:Uncharacterized protein n=1 Tax=Aspergillus steynii IBT 23096 TaxID=1392250 RepID=A0A2I2GS71_9EURO|nr:uncharacterized protein P170DRAFT_471123 [Aspergillus steynii IBT 23096]PLB55719.1 hypothetical protein P170DRAFT_471123 [Aspergillus steynii IBT 23096]
MSRNFFPAIMAIGMGVYTGYYTFNPAFRELQSEKEPSQQAPGAPQSQGQSVAKPSANDSTPAKEDGNGNQ